VHAALWQGIQAINYLAPRRLLWALWGHAIDTYSEDEPAWLLYTMKPGFFETTLQYSRSELLFNGVVVPNMSSGDLVGTMNGDGMRKYVEKLWTDEMSRFPIRFDKLRDASALRCLADGMDPADITMRLYRERTPSSVSADVRNVTGGKKFITVSPDGFLKPTVVQGRSDLFTDLAILYTYFRTNGAAVDVDGIDARTAAGNGSLVAGANTEAMRQLPPAPIPLQDVPDADMGLVFANKLPPSGRCGAAAVSKNDPRHDSLVELANIPAVPLWWWSAFGT